MRGKVLFSATVLATLFAVLAAMSGCNRKGDALGPQSFNSESAGPVHSELIEGVPESIDYHTSYAGTGQGNSSEGPRLTLSNGMTVVVNSYSTVLDTFQINITYQGANSTPVNRLLKLGSLAGASLVDSDGAVLFEYDYKLIDDDQFEFYARTDKDSIALIQVVENGSVTSTYTFRGNTFILSFQSIQEVLRAKELYNAHRGTGNLTSLSSDDQELLAKLMNLESFFNVSSSFENNDDVEVVLTLMTNPGFIYWRHTKFTNALKGCGEECICGIATLVSFGSTFLGPIGMALAMPAHGVSLACGIKGVLSAIF